jgi:hypothetical protein
MMSPRPFSKAFYSPAEFLQIIPRRILKGFQAELGNDGQNMIKDGRLNRVIVDQTIAFSLEKA